MRWRAAWVGLVVSMGCGAPAQRSEVALAIEDMPPQRSAEDTAPPDPGVFLTRGVDLYDGHLHLRRADESSERFFVGAFRVERQGGVVRLAEEAFSSPIQLARRCGDGWVLLTGHGHLAYTTQFLGRSTPLATLPTSPRSMAMGWTASVHDGTVVYGAHAGMAFVGRCDEAPRRIAPIEGDFTLAASISAEGLFAMSLGGAVHRSSDSGVTWSVVNLGGAADELRGNHVRMGERWFAISANGRSVPAQPQPEAPSDVLDDDLARAMTAQIFQDPLARRTILGTFPRSPSSERVLVESAEGPMWLVGADGVRPFTEIGGIPCTQAHVAPWGAGFAVSCSEADLFVTRDFATFEPFSMPGEDVAESVELAPDGSLLAMSRLRGAPPCCRALIRIAPDGSRTEHPLPSGAQRFGHVRADAVGSVLLQSADSPDVHAWRIGAEETIPLNASSGYIAIQPDGLVWGWEGDRDSREWYTAEPPRYEQRPFTPPRGAGAVGFTDRGFGVAVGQTLASVWTTTDEGRTWIPLEIELDGDRAATRIARFERLDRAPYVMLDCSEHSCWLHGFVVRRNPSDRPRYVGPRSVAETVAQVDWEPVWLECEVGTPLRRSQARGIEGASLGWESRGTAARTQTRYRWTYDDDHVLSSAWARLAALGVDDLGACEGRWLGPDAALLECGERTVWAGTGDVPRVVLERAAGAATDALAQPDGALWVETGGAAREYLGIDARGRVAWRRALSLPEVSYTLARHGSEPFVLVSVGTGARAVPLRRPGAPSEPVPWPPAEAPPVCAGGEPEWELERPAELVDMSGVMDATLQYRAGAWCIAGAHSDRIRETALIDLTAVDGALVGYHQDESGRATLRCAPVAQP